MTLLDQIEKHRLKTMKTQLGYRVGSGDRSKHPEAALECSNRGKRGSVRLFWSNLNESIYKAEDLALLFSLVNFGMRILLTD